MPLPSWVTLRGLGVGGSFGAAPTLANVGAAPFADRFGQWSNTTTPSGRLPAWEPDPSMFARPPGWQADVGPDAGAPGGVGYLPSAPMASGTSLPAPRQEPPAWAQFLANFDFQPARPVPQAPPFAFSGRPISLGAIGGQHKIAGLPRPPQRAGDYGGPA